jgi:NitT/TauT family transport system substrate-binding protein
MSIIQSRRDFMASLSAAGAAGLLGARASLADEGPLETTTIRLPHNSNICLAPQYVAEELLRTEGFTDVRYVQGTGVSRSRRWPDAARSTSA